jgi:hypothetical protein
MKRVLLSATLIAAIAAVGRIVAAEAPAPKADDHAAHATSQPMGMMGGGMGMGMMGGGMCPMMIGDAKTKMEVKKIDKGVTITMTSADPAVVTRLQKMAEAMRLMHEANTL